MSKIKVGVVGVGNCANSLISGIEWYKQYYKDNKLGNAPGVVNEIIDKYKVTDIEVVAAFDVDENKVNKDLFLYSPDFILSANSCRPPSIHLS